jgi:hypothetical protein
MLMLAGCSSCSTIVDRALLRPATAASAAQTATETAQCSRAAIPTCNEVR